MRTLTSGLLLAALALGTACSDSSPTGPGGTTGTVLTLGSARAISGASSSQTVYTVVVPAGQPALRVATSGGTGDADLYVRFGSAATPTSYDCGSAGDDNNEECVIISPSAGTWYITVIGFEAYSGAQLLAQITAAPTSTALTSGVPVANLSGARNSQRLFTINVPAGATSLTVTTSGSDVGDADLYVRQGVPATTVTYNCSSENGGNSETCSISSPTAGTWHILLYGYDAYSGVTLTATVTTP